MGIYSSSQFMGAFVGGALGGWALGSIGVDGLFIVASCNYASMVGFCAWYAIPKPLKSLVLQVPDKDSNEFKKIISSIVGVEDILLIEGEDLAYLKVDPKVIDMAILEPYFNRK